MIDAVIKALRQMLSPPLRELLLKAMGLALLLLVLAGVGLHRLLAWLATMGEHWAENALGATAHTPLVILSWIVSVTAGLGIAVGSVFLMPAVTALIGSFFVDDVALEVERLHYPRERPGTPLAPARAVLEGCKIAVLAIVVYLIAVPFLFVGRYRPPAEAKLLRRQMQSEVFLAGMFIAAFVSIPIVSLATPLFAMALMVHVHMRSMRGAQKEVARVP